MTGETEIQSFSAKWIIWLGIVITIIGLLVLYSQENDKQAINRKTEPSSFRPLSGILKIPAGSGIYDTGIKCQKGERWWFKSESKVTVLLWDERGKKIKIPHNGISYPCVLIGPLEFVKQKTPTRVSYKISSSS